MLSQRNYAPVLMLAGAAIIGTNGLMVRLAETPPTVSAFYRMLFSAVLLAVYAKLVGRWRPLPRRIWWLATLPAAMFAIDLWLWHRSILLVGPGLATLLANTQVFFMALAGVVVLRERVGPRFIGGLLLAFFGLWLMLGAHWSQVSPDYRWGVGLGLATGLCYAIHNVGLRRAQRVARDQADAAAVGAPVEQVLALVALLCAACLGALGWAEGASFAIPDGRSLGILLVLAGFGHCLSWVMISRAMTELSVAVIGLMLLAQPIVAFLLDVWLFDRGTSAREWTGLGFSLAGIFLASLRGRSRLPEQAT